MLNLNIADVSRKSRGASSISGLMGSRPVGLGREHNSLLKLRETRNHSEKRYVSTAGYSAVGNS